MSPRYVRADYPRGDRPYLDAIVSMASGALGTVPFLVDTGADRTTIGYADRFRIGIPPGRAFSSHVNLGGIGGAAWYGEEDASIVLRATRGDEPDQITLALPILVAENPVDDISLLGRDVLYRFTLTMTDSMVILAE